MIECGGDLHVLRPMWRPGGGIGEFLPVVREEFWQRSTEHCAGYDRGRPGVAPYPEARDLLADLRRMAPDGRPRHEDVSLGLVELRLLSMVPRHCSVVELPLPADRWSRSSGRMGIAGTTSVGPHPGDRAGGSIVIQVPDRNRTGYL